MLSCLVLVQASPYLNGSPLKKPHNAWRCADSLSLRAFLRIELSEGRCAVSERREACWEPSA